MTLTKEQENNKDKEELEDIKQNISINHTLNNVCISINDVVVELYTENHNILRKQSTLRKSEL